MDFFLNHVFSMIVLSFEHDTIPIIVQDLLKYFFS